MDNIVVRFTKPVTPYNVGESAGFSPVKAEKLIKSGRAELFDTELAAEAVAEATAKAEKAKEDEKKKQASAVRRIKEDAAEKAKKK